MEALSDTKSDNGKAEQVRIVLLWLVFTYCSSNVFEKLKFHEFPNAYQCHNGAKYGSIICRFIKCLLHIFKNIPSPMAFA